MIKSRPLIRPNLLKTHCRAPPRQWTRRSRKVLPPSPPLQQCQTSCDAPATASIRLKSLGTCMWLPVGSSVSVVPLNRTSRYSDSQKGFIGQFVYLKGFNPSPDRMFGGCRATRSRYRLSSSSRWLRGLALSRLAMQQTAMPPTGSPSNPKTSMGPGLPHRFRHSRSRTRPRPEPDSNRLLPMSKLCESLLRRGTEERHPT